MSCAFLACFSKLRYKGNTFFWYMQIFFYFLTEICSPITVYAE